MTSSESEPQTAARWHAVAVLTLDIVTCLLVGACESQPATPAAARPSPQLCVSGPMHSSDGFASVHGYITYRDGSEIWAVDPNHPANRISLGPSYGLAPVVWSGDGRRLLLRTRVNDAYTGDLCVMNADGSLTQLISDGLGGQGSFSPDATKVLFPRDDGLYVVDAKGGTPRLIAKPFGMSPYESFALSRDGSRIAYMVFVTDGIYQIWTVRSDGTDPRLLIDLGLCERGGCSGGLAWSPDGSTLAFHSSRGNPRSLYSAIYTVRADGSGLRRIFADGGVEPSWSPDGSRIAFYRAGELFTMAPDGSDVTLVEGVFLIDCPGLAWNPVLGVSAGVKLPR
jgi:Tol biopolymer transport system component